MQNRLAQRSYRQRLKQRLEKTGEMENRAASTSPPSTSVTPVGLQPILSNRDRSRSTGAEINTTLVPPPRIPLLQELFPEQYLSLDDGPSSGREGYLEQESTPAPVRYPFPGYPQPLPAFYPEYGHATTYASLPPVPVPVPVSVPSASPMHQGWLGVEESPLTANSGASFRSVMSSSQGDFYPVDESPSYGIDYAPTYDSSQVAVSQAYTGSANPVNPSDYFAYSSS